MHEGACLGGGGGSHLPRHLSCWRSYALPHNISASGSFAFLQRRCFVLPVVGSVAYATQALSRLWKETPRRADTPVANFSRAAYQSLISCNSLDDSKLDFQCKIEAPCAASPHLVQGDALQLGDALRREQVGHLGGLGRVAVAEDVQRAAKR